MPDSPHSEPDARRKSFLATHDTRVIRMEDELQRMIRLVAHARESLESEMLSGLAYKKSGVPENDLKRLKELTSSFNSLTDAKIRLDKTAKDRAANLTPEEERAAVVTYVKALELKSRGRLLRECLDHHNHELSNTWGKGDRGQDSQNPMPELADDGSSQP